MAHELDVIIGAAKKDPRYSKLKGEDPEVDADKGGDDLDKVFSKSQAAAVRAYVDSCMSGDRS